MILHRRYGIAIADNVYHLRYGMGSYKPDLKSKRRGMRVEFKDGSVKYVDECELYHPKSEWFETVILLMALPMFYLFDHMPVLRLKIK